MELNLQAADGQSRMLQVSDRVFGVEYKPTLIHQVVSAYMNAGRAGTKAQKSRAAVRGGGAKPWRQKGTGRARAGTIRSPIWTGGGVTFAAAPRSYAQKVNRKMYRGAVRSILSELARQRRLVVVDDIDVESPKTRLLASRLKAMDIAEALLVTEQLGENIALAARNIPNIGVLTVSELDPVSLIAFDRIVMTEGAVKKLEERLV